MQRPPKSFSALAANHFLARCEPFLYVTPSLFVLQKVHTLFLLGVGAAEDDAGCTKGEEGAVLDDAALAGLQLDVTDKGAAVAVVVAERVAQLTTLVTADGQCAVVQVNTGVDGLEGCVDGIALLVAAYDVVAHVEGNDLLVVEDVLNDDDAAIIGGESI